MVYELEVQLLRLHVKRNQLRWFSNLVEMRFQMVGDPRVELGHTADRM